MNPPYQKVFTLLDNTDCIKYYDVDFTALKDPYTEVRWYNRQIVTFDKRTLKRLRTMLNDMDLD